MKNPKTDTLELVANKVLTRSQLKRIQENSYHEINNGGIPKHCNYTCFFGEPEQSFPYGGGLCNTVVNCTFFTPCSMNGDPWRIQVTCT